MLRHIGSAFQRYGFALERKLFVNDPLRFDPANESGIRATVFGPSGTPLFTQDSSEDQSAPRSVVLEVI